MAPYDPISWLEKPKEIKRHKKERAKRGFSTHDWWNADQHLAFVVAGIVRKFIDEGHGCPAHLTPESWNFTLEQIEKGMKDYLDWRDGKIAALPPASFEKAKTLLAAYWGDLWD